MSLTEEDAWGQWLADNDYTPESVREEIVNSFVDQELVKQGGEAEALPPIPPRSISTWKPCVATMILIVPGPRPSRPWA